MAEKFNEIESEKLARLIRQRRHEFGLTIGALAHFTGVDGGQISRFESAQFKLASKNLQKLCIFLQIQMQVSELDIESRVKRLVAKSPSHRYAIEELLRIFEQLDFRGPSG